MEWNRSETIGTANMKCAHCHGEGLRVLSRKTSSPANPCNCSLRGIFRACFSKFRDCATKPKHLSRATLQSCSGRSGMRVWGRKDEEYMADFHLVARRSLDDFHYKIFRFHFLLGADWRLCCRKLNMDRGNFFHAVYRIQQQLGRTFRELKPYALFPVDEYFAGSIQRSAVSSSKSNLLQMPTQGARKRLQPPLRETKAA